MEEALVPDVITHLLRLGADHMARDASSGLRNALCLAARVGKTAVLGALLGAEVYPDAELSTALLDASGAGQVQAVEALVRAGANVNAVHWAGNFPSRRPTPLIAAASGGHAPVVEVLLAEGANVNAVACDGWTGLMEAASLGHAHVVQMLIEAGANIGVRSCHGHSALDHADEADVVELLMAGAATAGRSGDDGKE
jgi:ankyrin repeat protein